MSMSLSRSHIPLPRSLWDRRCTGTYSPFRGPHRDRNSLTLPHGKGLHPMSIYRILWWVAAAILTASGGIVAFLTVSADVLVSAMIAAVLIGAGSPWLRPITLRTTPPPRTLLAIALRDGATWAAVVAGVIGLIAVSGAAALPLILLMTVTSPPVSRYCRGRIEVTQARPCSPTSPLMHTSTVEVRFFRCRTAATCRTKLCADVGERVMPRCTMIHRHRLRTRCTSRVPASATSTNSNVAILEDSPDGSAAALVTVVTPRSSSPHEIIRNPRHSSPERTFLKDTDTTT